MAMAKKNFDNINTAAAQERAKRVKSSSASQLQEGLVLNAKWDSLHKSGYNKFISFGIVANDAHSYFTAMCAVKVMFVTVVAVVSSVCSCRC